MATYTIDSSRAELQTVLSTMVNWSYEDDELSCENVKRQGTSKPPQGAVECLHLPLTSPVISPLLLMKKWQVRVISLGMCPIVRICAVTQMHCDCLFVMLVVDFTNRLQPLTNLRSPYPFVHVYMMATHSALHCELVSCSPWFFHHSSRLFLQIEINCDRFCVLLWVTLDRF